MKTYMVNYLLLLLLFLGSYGLTLAQNPPFPWPDGKKMAISLSFDDARTSNPTLGIPLLNEYDVKATFFIVPSNVEKNVEGWKMAVNSGHEMGNHSVNHPCSGNFPWSRNRALEDYTIERMRNELLDANSQIESLLGVTPKVYAYPCGLTFIGKGAYTKSFVPLVSELFMAGRGWLDEAPADPIYVDMAQLTGMKMDNMTFDELLPIIENARKNGHWLVLAGHETKDEGSQTTYLNTLRELCRYAKDPNNEIWIESIGTVAEYVDKKRSEMKGNLNIPEIARPSADNKILLTAENGKGIGPDIQYMPEWNAFGWFTAKDQVVWDIELPQGGDYEVWMEWSVSDEESGKDYVISNGDQEITGTVAKSGSWETFQTIKVGKINLKSDYNQIMVKSKDSFDKGALMDLKALTLIPMK